MKELTERTRKVQERHNQITCNNSVYQTGECKLPRQTTMEHPIEHMEVLDDYELIETDQQTEVANLGDDDFIEIDRGPNFSIENETVQPRVTPDDIDLDLDSETVSPPKATTSALPNHIVVGSEDEQPEATTRLSRLLLEHEKLANNLYTGDPSRPFPANSDLEYYAEIFYKQYQNQILEESNLEKSVVDLHSVGVLYFLREVIKYSFFPTLDKLSTLLEIMGQPMSLGQNEVITTFWPIYLRDLQKGYDQQKATRRYIGKTLLFAFLDRRITLFSNWEGAQQMVLDATSKLLRKRNPQKWDHMQRIRDKFRECWHYTVAQLRSQPDISEQFSKVFSDARVTWNQAMKATSEIQTGKLPTSAQCAALLVLGWAMDLVQNENDAGLEASPNFKSDLVKWLSLFEGSSGDSQKELVIFLNKIWPDSGSTQIPVGAVKGISGFGSKMMEDIKRDFIETNPVGKDFMIAEMLIEHLMEDIGQYFDKLDMISLDASTVGFSLVDDEDAKNSGKVGPTRTDVARKNPPLERGPKFPIEVIIPYLRTGEILPSVVSFFSGTAEFGIPLPIFMGMLAKNVLSTCVETTARQMSQVLTITPSLRKVILAYDLGSRYQLPENYDRECRQEVQGTIHSSTGQQISPYLGPLTPPPMAIHTPASSVVTPGPVFSAPSSPWNAETRYRLCPKCGIQVKSKSNLSRHDRSVHGKPYECPGCGKKLKPRADYRKKHQRVCLALRTEASESPIIMANY